jgi:hypothetical protein
VGTWAFITACNPFSELWSDQDNLGRMRELERELQSSSFKIFPGHGQGDDPRWKPEPSLLVLGINEAQATEVARKYGQNAIVFGVRGEPAKLLWI